MFFFSRFYDKRDAEDALDAMDGRMLDGRELRVQMARYGRPTSPYRRRRRRFEIQIPISLLYYLIKTELANWNIQIFNHSLIPIHYYGI